MMIIFLCFVAQDVFCETCTWPHVFKNLDYFCVIPHTCSQTFHVPNSPCYCCCAWSRDLLTPVPCWTTSRCVLPRIQILHHAEHNRQTYLTMLILFLFRHAPPGVSSSPWLWWLYPYTYSSFNAVGALMGSPLRPVVTSNATSLFSRYAIHSYKLTNLFISVVLFGVLIVNNRHGNCYPPRGTRVLYLEFVACLRAL